MCLAFAIAGCSNDPVRSRTIPPTLTEIWPSATGLTWTYKSVSRGWDTPPVVAVYANASLVPPVTFDTVAAVLAARPAGTNATTDSASFQLVFGDTLRLVTGILVRPLDELPVGGNRTGRFLHGGYWRRTSEWIGTHAAFDTLPAWKFLEADLSVGHTFSLALLPELAPDVMLHARVVRSLSVSTPGGTIANGIEVHYFVDFGINEMTDDGGAPIGLARQFACGAVLYAPGVGPVRNDERGGLFAGASLRPGYGDLLITLTSGPTPATSVANRFAR